MDAAVGYDIGSGRTHSEAEQSSTRGSQVAIRARNAFNHQPPFLNNQYGIGYDQENSNLLGREVTFELIWRW